MGSFQWGVRQSTEMENQMTSTERIIAYSKLTPEASLETLPPHSPPTDDWPQRGAIAFRNLSLSYAPGGLSVVFVFVASGVTYTTFAAPSVLKDVSAAIRPKEKIG